MSEKEKEYIEKKLDESGISLGDVVYGNRNDVIGIFEKKGIVLGNRNGWDVYKYVCDVWKFGVEKLWMGVVSIDEVYDRKGRNEMSYFEEIRYNNWYRRRGDLWSKEIFMNNSISNRIRCSNFHGGSYKRNSELKKSEIFSGDVNTITCFEVVDDYNHIIVAGGGGLSDQDSYGKGNANEYIEGKAKLISYDLTKREKDGNPKCEILIGNYASVNGLCVSDVKITRCKDSNKPIIASTSSNGEIITFIYDENFDSGMNKGKYKIHKRFAQKTYKGHDAEGKDEIIPVTYNWIACSERTNLMYVSDNIGEISICDIRSNRGKKKDPPPQFANMDGFDEEEYLKNADYKREDDLLIDPKRKGIDEIVLDDMENRLYCLKSSDVYDGFIKFFDIGRNEKIDDVILSGREKNVQQFSVNLSNKDILFGGDTVTILHPGSGNKDTVCKEFSGSISSLSYSNDFQYFQFTLENCQYLFDLRNLEKPILQLTNNEDIVSGRFSRKYDYLVNASSYIEVFDYHKNKKKPFSRRSEKCNEKMGKFEFVNFNINDDILIAGSKDFDSIKIWYDYNGVYI